MRSSAARTLKLIGATGSLLLAGAAGATGWTQPTGGHYAKIWGRLLTGNKIMSASGEKLELADRFNDVALNLYGQYGVNDRITLIGFANPVGFANHTAEDGGGHAYSGFFGGGVRMGHEVGRVRLAAEARYGYAPNAGARPVGVGVQDDIAYILQPTVRTHRFEGEAQIGVPLSFGWFAASAGIRGFTAAAIDPAVIGSVQLGWQPSARWTLDLHSHVNQPTGDVVVTNGLGAGQTSFLGFGVGGTFWATERFGVNAGVDLAGRIRSNAAVPSLALGVELR